VINIKQFEVGMTFEKELRPTLAQGQAYATLFGDHNPVHFDDEAARSRGFKEKVVHGTMVATMADSMLTEAVDGVIAVSKFIRFVRPIFYEDAVIVRAKLTKTDDQKRGIAMTWEVTYTSRGKTCISMVAEVFLPKL
jgi:3-hydroxybutyryl-CoA dehydratase